MPDDSNIVMGVFENEIAPLQLWLDFAVSNTRHTTPVTTDTRHASVS
jgi:hypothetical protein